MVYTLLEMFREIMEAVGEEFSGLAAHRYVGEIIQYHRLQASPGYRRAAEHAYQKLLDFGLEAEILSYPAREGITFWAQPSFQEWEARDGVLHLLEPEARKLADYREIKLSLIQRSASFEGEAEIVLLEDGLEVEEYEGLDLEGKVVLTKGDVRRVRYLAVEKGGAVGIIHDGIKELPGLERRLDNALQYTSFWWYGGERKCFGFVLSPQEGERLRRSIKRGSVAKVRAKVISCFWDGSLEVVSAFLPGESDEEVAVVAHLCHPQWSANDNASGSATLLEVARALKRLTLRGRLKKPRRSIRVLLVPELTGTYAYLAAHEERLPQMIAGLNLDMVGESQELCGSTLVVERLPGSTPAFSGDLLERLLEAVADAGAGSYPSFRHGSTPFSGGSDHIILSDPTVEIPSPLLIQWPDRFHHTSLDTQDKVDPQMLARVGKVAGTYAYFLALAGREEATWLAWEMLTRFKERLVRLVQEERGAGRELVRKVGRLQNQGILGLRSLRRLADIELKRFESELSSFTHRELKNVLGLRSQGEVKPTENEWEEEARRLVPCRLYKGPIRVPPYLRRLSSEERKRWWRLEHRYGNALWYLLPLTLYWADGKRTLHEIVDLVEMETGKRAAELLVTYCRTLSDLDLLHLLER
jgi:aminopeptidase YwaD